MDCSLVSSFPYFALTHIEELDSFRDTTAAWPISTFIIHNRLSANPTIWSNTLKQFFGNSRRIV